MCLVLAPAWAAAQAQPISIADQDEILAHVIKPIPKVPLPWRDISRDHQEYASWTFELGVDEQGAVTAARLKEGSRARRDQAMRIVRSLRFKPFVSEGRAMPARLEFILEGQTTDYAGPADRSFPADPDPATTVIALSRTICMGSCPAYRVELRGDGEVYYAGRQNVVVRGQHRWHVDPATLAPLFELLRRANYFALDGYYDDELTDQPSCTTRVSIGDRHKFVYDYGGRFGISIAATDRTDKKFQLPAIVPEIEDAIDKVSGVESFVNGDASTMQKLRGERWNFRSRDAGLGLQALAYACKTDLALEFVRAGAPVNVVDGDEGGEPPISAAARCGDVELTRAMIAKGALRKGPDARMFISWSVDSGQPGIVELALPHYRDVNRQEKDGGSLLWLAAGSMPPDDEAPGAATFDPARVVELLIDAGADPNIRNNEGKTPLFNSNHEGVTTALLKRGADPHARDKSGRTALFDRYFMKEKRPLIAAGTDVNARDQWGQTALFYQDGAEAIKLLLDAGADPNAADSKGRTAIEQLNSPGAFQALLDGGARLPADPARLDAMIADATRNRFTEVLPVLEAAKAK
ncbi:MAG TPA: DUF6438 domain-containing protein [Steroidobacteraceae bacterium]|nr:DUF6438 domain-containing protein [Steroidobacteraceae bacterium]